MKNYQPDLIACIHPCDHQAVGIDCVARYEFMGKAEFDYGLGPSIKRLRERATELQIVESPANLKALSGPYSGLTLKVLARKETLSDLGDTLWESLQKLASNHSASRLDAAFDQHRDDHMLASAAEIAGYSRKLPCFGAWHDIESDLIFSFSEPYLKLIQAILGRTSSPQDLREGQELHAVIPRAGLVTGYERSVERWTEEAVSVIALENGKLVVQAADGVHKLNPHMVIGSAESEADAADSSIRRVLKYLNSFCRSA